MTETKRVGHSMSAPTSKAPPSVALNLGRAYAFTWRPKGGAHESCQEQWLKLLADLFDSWTIAAEMDGEARHFHIKAIAKKEWEPKKLNQAIKRKFKAYMDTPQMEGTLWYKAFKPNRWFEGTGWDEYISKEGSTVVDSNIQRDIRDLLWADIPLAERKKEKAWKEMHRLLRLSKELRKPSGNAYRFENVEDVLHFLVNCVIVHHVYKPPKTDRELNNFACWMWRFMSVKGDGQYRFGVECETNKVVTSMYNHYEQDATDKR